MSAGNEAYTGVYNNPSQISHLNAGDLSVSNASAVNITTKSFRASSENIDTTKTLTTEDSGKLFAVSINSGYENIITLPLPENGLVFEFVARDNFTESVFIQTYSSAPIIYGNVSYITGGTRGDSFSGSNTVGFEFSKAVKGDRIRLCSDGTSWYISGECKNDGGIQ